MTATFAPQVRVAADPGAVAALVAAETCRHLAVAQERYGDASLALTGGSMGGAVVRALARPDGATAQACRGLDWARVDVWWSDERFLPHGDPDRNDTQADEDGLLDIGLDPLRIFRAPDPSTTADDLKAAALRYEARLDRHPGAQDVPGISGGRAPRIDVMLLGVGPDGHVASLFLGHPGAMRADATVIDVSDSPKPPPRRVSWSMPLICASRQAWLVATGAEKAGALATAFAQAAAGAALDSLPAARVRGREATVWWVDGAAGADI